MLKNNQENARTYIDHFRRCTSHPTQQRETCGLSFRQFPLVLMLKLPENNKKEQQQQQQSCAHAKTAWEQQQQQNNNIMCSC